MRKPVNRLLCLALCCTMVGSALPHTAFAVAGKQGGGSVTGGLCEHHPEHTEECGYAEAETGADCRHEHTDKCYQKVESCAHDHTEDCYPEENETEDETELSGRKQAEPTLCTHKCSEDSNCIQEVLRCNHRQHDEECGYIPATKGTPCGYVCEICAEQNDGRIEEELKDSDKPEDTIVNGIQQGDMPQNGSQSGNNLQNLQNTQNILQTGQKPQPDEEKCICLKPCTEEEINKDCPVCGAEDADLADCEGVELVTATSSNAMKLTAEEVQDMIHALPTLDELKAMTEEQQREAYMEIQKAYEAYEGLSDEEKDKVSEVEVLEGLLEFFNNMANALEVADTGDFLVTPEEGNADKSYSFENGVLTVNSGAKITISMREGSPERTGHRIEVYGDAEIKLDGVNINCDAAAAVEVKSGTLTLKLKDGTVNAFQSAIYTAGIQVLDTATLKICCETETHAYGDCGDTCGKVEATGGSYGAGIGDGMDGSGGEITISGGEVTATGGIEAAGIDGGTITISGGEVTATGGYEAAGIGGGFKGSGGTIKISGGTVTAKNGSDSVFSIGDKNNSTFSTGENGNAVIFANKLDSALDGCSGVIFIGNEGKVYGQNDTVTPTTDFTIESGMELEIEDTKTLEIPTGVTLTNNGTITGYGTLTGDGKLQGTGTVAETVKNDFRKESEIRITFNKSSVKFGDVVTITAEIAQKPQAGRSAKAVSNTVDFYVGTGDDKKCLGWAIVNGTTAILENVNVNADTGFIVGDNTITAEYGGSMLFSEKSGTATIRVSADSASGSEGGSGSGSTGSGSSSSGGGSGSGGSSSDGSSGSTSSSTRPNESKPNQQTAVQTQPISPDAGGNATVDKNTIQNAINAGKTEANKNGVSGNGVAVTVPIGNQANAGSLTVRITAETLDALIQSEIKRFEITTNGFLCLGFTLDTLKMLVSQLQGGDLVLGMKTVVPASDMAKAAIGNRPMWEISLAGEKNGVATPVNDWQGKTISVRFPYELKQDEQAGRIAAVYVKDDGSVEWLAKSSYNADSKAVLMEAAHFSAYGIGYKNDIPAFTDIENHWAKEQILFAVSRGLFTDTGNTGAATFSPDTAMTRAALAAALGRLEGIDPAGYQTGKFADVPADARYAPYVNWAADKGIMGGTGETTFSPDSTVTREQMAVILEKCSKQTGYTLPKTLGAVTYADSAQIGADAKEAVKALQQAGILSSKDGNRFDPKGTATRAEAASALQRLVETMIDPQTANGWAKNDSGQYSYYQNGVKMTGWLRDEEKWYWLDKENGKMFSGGWKQIGGKWYYFYADGSMAADTTVDGYPVGSDGAWQS